MASNKSESLIGVSLLSGLAGGFIYQLLVDPPDWLSELFNPSTSGELMPLAQELTLAEPSFSGAIVIGEENGKAVLFFPCSRCQYAHASFEHWVRCKVRSCNMAWMVQAPELPPKPFSRARLVNLGWIGDGWTRVPFAGVVRDLFGQGPLAMQCPCIKCACEIGEHTRFADWLFCNYRLCLKCLAKHESKRDWQICQTEPCFRCGEKHLSRTSRQQCRDRHRSAKPGRRSIERMAGSAAPMPQLLPAPVATAESNGTDQPKKRGRKIKPENKEAADKMTDYLKTKGQDVGEWLKLEREDRLKAWSEVWHQYSLEICGELTWKLVKKSQGAKDRIQRGAESKIRKDLKAAAE